MIIVFLLKSLKPEQIVSNRYSVLTSRKIVLTSNGPCAQTKITSDANINEA